MKYLLPCDYEIKDEIDLPDYGVKIREIHGKYLKSYRDTITIRHLIEVEIDKKNDQKEAVEKLRNIGFVISSYGVFDMDMFYLVKRYFYDAHTSQDVFLDEPNWGWHIDFKFLSDQDLSEKYFYKQKFEGQYASHTLSTPFFDSLKSYIITIFSSIHRDSILEKLGILTFASYADRQIRFIENSESLFIQQLQIIIESCLPEQNKRKKCKNCGKEFSVQMSIEERLKEFMKSINFEEKVQERIQKTFRDFKVIRNDYTHRLKLYYGSKELIVPIRLNLWTSL